MDESMQEAKYVIKDDENIVTAMQELARNRPNTVSISRLKDFEWIEVTAKDFMAEVFAVAKGLIANGVEAGDRVALLSETRYEWTLLDMAIFAAGATVVPIYGSSSSEQIRWIIEDSGAVIGITENEEHTSRMHELLLSKDGTPQLVDSPSKLRRILEINASAVDTLMFEGRGIKDEVVQERIDATGADDLAAIIYTSGTTGRPKGCMLRHSNLLGEARAVLTSAFGQIARPGNRVLTFLPLAHIFSHAVHLAVLISGATQSHWADTSTVTLEFQRSKPHLILAVPRVFEKVRDAAKATAYAKGSIGKAIWAGAEDTAIAYSKAMDTPQGPSKLLKAKRALFDRLLYAKVRTALGDEVMAAISGGSALGSDLAHFLRGLGVETFEGYGLTETTAALTVNTPGDVRVGTVGRPVSGNAVRIGEDGEILAKGDVVFHGYWKNEKATDEAFVDGWFRTGDIGKIDEDGFLSITGRKKEILVTAGGKNVAPAPLEDRLRAHPLVSQAMLVGDGRPFISTLITLDEEALTKWRADHNVPENRSKRELLADPLLRAEIQDAVNNANTLVSHAEAIKKFWILENDFTEESGELTPSLKVKRHIVTKNQDALIENLYKR